MESSSAEMNRFDGLVPARGAPLDGNPSNKLQRPLNQWFRPAKGVANGDLRAMTFTGVKCVF
jgi:hypothetical protein